MKKLILSAFLLGSLFVAGCTNYVRSDVTRFYSPNGLSEAKSFVFLPTPEQFKSLEYKSYGALIAGEMREEGFRLVEKKSQANYGVRFNYGTNGGETVIEQDPFFGSVGVGTGSRGTGVNVGVGTVFGTGGFGGRSNTDIYTEYARRLTLDIIDLSDDSNVFEGTVTSRGNASSFAPVSACLIAAMFEDFPGENGDTQRVNIDADICAK